MRTKIDVMVASRDRESGGVIMTTTTFKLRKKQKATKKMLREIEQQYIVLSEAILVKHDLLPMFIAVVKYKE